MNRAVILSLSGILLLSTCSTPDAPPPPKEPPGQILLSADWLIERLNHPAVLVLHIGGLRREYEGGHIPGARYLWGQSLYPSSPEQTYGFPSREQCEKVLQEAGVTSGTRIVLYGTGEQVTPVARVFVALEYLGAADTISILDGGLNAWTAAGFPVTTEEARPTSIPAVTLQIRPDVIIDGDWVLARLNRPGVKIIDSRSNRFYNGEGGGMPRPGRIPGAGNVQYTDVVDNDNRMKRPDSLRALFAAAGAAPDDTVATYCHIGMQASLVYVAARYAGYQARMYDGSFEDWSGREELPLDGPSQTP